MIQVESPWAIGDVGWAILENTESSFKTCDSCGHREKTNILQRKVRECEIDRIDIVLDSQGTTYWYRVGFDIGDTSHTTRFTYGTNGVKNVWATQEEAEDFLRSTP